MLKYITKPYLLQCLKNFYTKIILPLAARLQNNLTASTGLSIANKEIKVNADSGMSNASTNIATNKAFTTELNKKHRLRYFTTPTLTVSLGAVNDGNWARSSLNVLKNYLPAGVSRSQVVSFLMVTWDSSCCFLYSDWGTQNSTGDWDIGVYFPARGSNGTLHTKVKVWYYSA